MSAPKHTAGLHRGYADNVRIDWDNRKGGFSSIALLNARKRPVAVLLGEYVPGQLDTDLDAAASLFCGAQEALSALTELRAATDQLVNTLALATDRTTRHLYDLDSVAAHAERKLAGPLKAARAAIAKATGESPQ